MTHVRSIVSFSFCLPNTIDSAAAWVSGTAFINRQTELVEAFADEMTYHVGDEREMELCVKEYKGKLGPKLYREAMFKVRTVIFACLLAAGVVGYNMVRSLGLAA